MEVGKVNQEMCVPGGYVVYILMEELPGIHPLNFWPRAFHEAMRCVTAFLLRGHRSEFNDVSEIFKCGIIPMDMSMENVLWDKSSKKW